MTSLHQPSETRAFTLFDVVRLLRKNRQKLVRAMIAGAVCGMLIVFSKPLQYEACATFKEGRDNKGTEGGSLRQLLTGSSLSGEMGQTPVLMRSDQVLHPTVAQLGLQASIPCGSKWGRALRRLSNLLKRELGFSLSDPDLFRFEQVEYEGAEDLCYQIRFEDPSHFIVFEHGKKVGQGEVGSPTILHGAPVCQEKKSVSFTIRQIPGNLKLKHTYSLRIAPWTDVVRRLRSSLEIVPDRVSQTVYHLTVSSPDRYLATSFVNTLMEQYRNYLNKEQALLAEDQLAYLNDKQGEIYRNLSRVFDDYTHYLEHNLSEQGLIGFGQKAEALSSLWRKLADAAGSIDSELGLLSRMEQEDGSGILQSDTPFSAEIQKIYMSIRDLKQQQDLLELAMYQGSLPRDGEEKHQQRVQSLKRIRKQRDAVQGVLYRVRQQIQGINFGKLHSVDILNSAEELISQKEASCLAAQNIELLREDLRELGGWVFSSFKDLDDMSRPEKEDLAGYLESYLRLLSIQEQIAQEYLFYEKDEVFGLEGLSLAAAEELIADYNKSLDQSSASISHWEQVLTQISREDFCISSLSFILKDPLSQKLMQDASQLWLRLRDAKHRSDKEEARWKEDLMLQKQILADHVRQLCEIERFSSDIIKEKLAGLGQHCLNCIHRKVSVLREQVHDAIGERRIILLREKEVLEQKRKELLNSASDLPEQWRREKWMKLHTDLGMKMIAAMSELVESKTISHHLHHIESKILDPATIPKAPLPPRLLLCSFAGAMIAALGTMFRMVSSSVIHGFAVSDETLRAIRYPLLGKISAFCDGPNAFPVQSSDLEVLRQIGLFMDSPPKNKIVGLLLGKGPDYSYSLAEILSRRDLKVLLVRCDFKSNFCSEEQPGILQLWKGEQALLPIRRKGNYDLISTGGFSVYGTEIIQSASFGSLLAACQRDYDLILPVFRAPLDSAESTASLAICEKAIVTATDETLEQLTPFMDWAYHEESPRLRWLWGLPGGIG